MGARRHRRRSRLRAGLVSLFLAALAWGGAAVPVRAQEGDVLVFAAASLKDALDEVNALWLEGAGHSAVVSFAGSPALARQIEQGAPADVFISADLQWMDYLGERGVVMPESRFNLLGNRIVLVAPRDSAVELSIGPGFPLRDALGPDGWLAMADVASVPAGRYGKAALERLAVWASVRDRVAQSENVRAALALVARGEAMLGIVYRTDAAAETQVRIVATFPDDVHPPIVYPLAVVTGSQSVHAAAYVDFLKSPAARRVFENWGFLAPE